MAEPDKLKYTGSGTVIKTFDKTLDELDSLIGRIDPNNKPVAESILSLMDTIHAEYADHLHFDQQGNPENSQLNYLYKQIKKQAKIIFTAMGGPHAYQKERSTRKIDKNAWWWYLDQYYENKQKRAALKTIKGFGIAAVVLVILIIVYQKFLAPPPEVRARLRFENQASMAISEGRFEDALSAVDSAITADPDEYELWVEQGVLLIALGQPEKAEPSFAEAQRLQPDQTLFIMERAYFSIQVGLLDIAQEAVDQLLLLDPQSAEAYLFQGQILETQGDFSKAIQVYQQASEMAEKQEKVELMTTIRVRLATLMQSALIPTAEN